MDDIFNTNPTSAPQQNNPPVTDGTQPENTNTATAYNAPAQPQQTAYNTPSQPQQPTYSAPQYSGTTYTPPYNAPQPSVAYNSAPYSAPHTPTYQESTTPNSSTTPSSAPQGIQFIKGQKKQKKTSVGKIVFIALICISIVLASVAIGTAFGDEPISGASDGATGSNNSVVAGDGAQANLEDSPVSYSEYSGSGPMTSEQIYNAVKEINVGVLVYSQNQMITEGSGIIVGEDEDGIYTYILTAAHVISDSNINVQIQFFDETETEAQIVGFDSKTDIGVVRVKKTGLKAATFGNSDKLAVGQKVYAIGNPGGTEFFGSFTSGMISAIDRPVPTSNSSYDLPCIQHNAAINPGNSGGALVNEYGQVIGLNSSKISSTEYEGMGFAVPSDTLIEIYNELIKNGYVSNRPMLGIQYYPVSSDYTYATIAWRNNLPYGSVAIAYISESSDLNNHGIKVGDIITAVNGEKLETTDTLLEVIENASVNDEITLTICRLNSNGSIGSTFDAKVKLVEDKGDNVVTEETTQEEDPFAYFEGFGY